ncbi:MAG: M28 family peptidase [Acidobacteriota bacterium]
MAVRTLVTTLLIPLVIVITAALAQTPPAPAPIAPDIQRTLDHLRQAALASDRGYDLVTRLVTEVGPRLAAADAEARARDWAVLMLRALNLENVRIEPFEVPFWQATCQRAAIVSPSPQPLVVAALAGSPSTPPGGIEAEVVRFPDLATFEAAPADAVRGRMVFIDEGMVRTETGEGYRAAVPRRGRCAPATQRKGGVACLIRSVGTNSNRQAHQGGDARQPNGFSLPAAALAPPDADVLARLLERGPVRVRLEIEAEMRERAPSGSVIAEVPGRERPDEIVLLAAHLDSWDLGQGATDDGFGVAVLAAAAALIRGLPPPPRRTIRIFLDGAEETLPVPGQDYIRRHGAERHVVAAEADHGAGRIWRIRTQFGPGRQPEAAAIARALAPLGILSGPNDAAGGEDIQPLLATGVPGMELTQDASASFDYHHTADDTLDKIDRVAMRQNVAAFAMFAYLAAESGWTFGRAQ